MAPMEAQAVVSWGDPNNFCTVSRAELCGEELLLILCVQGVDHAPGDTEVTTPGPSPLRLIGRPHATTRCLLDYLRRSTPQSGAKVTEVTLAFDCPPELQSAEDVLFSYAPGYDCVSILDLILSSLSPSRQAFRPSLDIESSPPKPRRAACPAAPEPRTPGEPFFNAVSSSSEPAAIDRQHSPVLRLLQPQQLPSAELFEHAKRENLVAMVGAGGQSISRESRRPSRTSVGPASAAASICCDAFFDAAEAGHVRTMPILELRLAELTRLRLAWQAGDVCCVGETLEAARDDALLFGALQRLQLCDQLALPPRSLARLLPLAQRLCQSTCELHAVAAMRFAIKAIEVSWPQVVRALRNVATPKPAFDDCQAALQSVAALFKKVKFMARSVRMSKISNGPLVPVCKELQKSLEKALAAVGRVRGSC